MDNSLPLYASLLQYMKALSTDTVLADVMLVACVENCTPQELPAHVCVLARSPVFQRMFTGSFVESTMRRVQIPVVKAKHLEVVRQYFYTDSMEFDASWTASDMVEVITLCDKYEMPGGLHLAVKQLQVQLKRLELLESERVVDHLSNTINNHAILKEIVHSLVSKVTFGDHVLLFLVWLDRLEQRIGLSLEAEQKQCLQQVTVDRSALEEELSVDLGNMDRESAMRFRLLLIAKFLECTSCELEASTEVYRGYPSRRMSLQVPINPAIKPSLTYVVQRLVQDVTTLSASQPPSSESQAFCQGTECKEPATKKQRVEEEEEEEEEIAHRCHQ